MSAGSTFTAPGNAKKFRSISYLLVFLMMACVVLTISVLIRSILPSWHVGMIEGILLFIVIDRLYTYRQLKSLPRWSSERMITLGTQWFVIVLFSRLLLSYASGPRTLISDLSLFARGYLVNLLTPEFVITLLLALACWSLSAQFLELLDEIGLDMDLASREEHAPIQNNTIPAHQRMVGLIFTTGIGLVIVTALTRFNIRDLAGASVGSSSLVLSDFSGAEAGALLYFVFGLALLSLSRLMSLQTQWNRLRITVFSSNLPRQWAIYSLFFLLLLAAISSLLPAGDSLGFFSVLSTLFGYLISVFVFIAQVIMALLLLFFSLLFVLFGQTPPFMRAATPPLVPTPLTEPLPAANTFAAWELIRSIFLWGALIAILIYSLVRFVNQHEAILAALRKSRVVNWLMLAWQWLYKNADQARGTLVSAIAGGWQNIVSRLERKRILPRPSWISLRSLDARRRVFFYYLAMIRRGGEQGLTRRPSQTPLEYAAKLEKTLPSVNEDIDSLTDAFVQARYSRHEINSSKVNQVKANWLRIRRALRDGGKGENTDNQ